MTYAKIVMVYLGINLLQLPTSTINLNGSFDFSPFLTPVMDIGYTVDYQKYKSYDITSNLLTSHIDLYDGYGIEKQSGEYIKLGTFINFRRSQQKQNFFHLGIFATNSFVQEKALYLSPADSKPFSYAEEISHNVHVFSMNTSFGYEFKVVKRLKGCLDFQASFPSDKYLDLYSYSNFISGIGYKDSQKKVFPMLVLNLKYQINK